MKLIESGNRWFVVNGSDILLKIKGYVEVGNIPIDYNFDSRIEEVFLTKKSMLSRIVKYMLDTYHYLKNKDNIFLFEIDEDTKTIKSKHPVNLDYFYKIYKLIKLTSVDEDTRRSQVIVNVKKIFDMLNVDLPERVERYLSMLQNDDVILLVDSVSDALVFDKTTETVIDTERLEFSISKLFRKYYLFDIVKDDVLKDLVDIKVYELKKGCSGYKIVVSINDYELTFRPPNYSLKEVLNFLDEHDAKYVYIPLEENELKDKKRIDIVLEKRSTVFKIVNENIDLLKIVYEYNGSFCPQYTIFEFDSNFNLVNFVNILIVDVVLIKDDDIYIIKASHNPMLEKISINDLKKSESVLEKFIDVMMGVDKTNEDAKQFLEKLSKDGVL